MRFEQPPAMPDMDAIADMEQQFEQLQTLTQMSLNKIVSIGGMQGTVEELIGLCPVPEDQRSPEATDRMTAKLLEEAGHEIPEQFAHLRRDAPPKETEQKQESQPRKIREEVDKPITLNRSEATTPPNSQPEAVTLIRKEYPTVILPVKPLDETINLALVAQQLRTERIVSDTVEFIVVQSSMSEDAPVLDRREIKSDVPAIDAIKTLASVPIEALPDMPNLSDNESDYADAVTAMTERILVPTIFIAPDTDAKTADVDEFPNAIDTEIVTRAYVASELALLYASVTQATVGETEQPQPVESPDHDAELRDILGLNEFEFFEKPEVSLVLPAPAVSPDMPNAILGETFDMSTEVIEPLNSADVIMLAVSEDVALSISETLQSESTEVVEELEIIITKIAKVSERLQLLVTTERAESNEAQLIKIAIADYYEQLAAFVDKSTTHAEAINFVKNLQELWPQLIDKGTHEQKQFSILQLAQYAAQSLHDELHGTLGHLGVHGSFALAA